MESWGWPRSDENKIYRIHCWLPNNDIVTLSLSLASLFGFTIKYNSKDSEWITHHSSDWNWVSKYQDWNYYCYCTFSIPKYLYEPNSWGLVVEHQLTSLQVNIKYWTTGKMSILPTFCLLILICINRKRKKKLGTNF